MARILARAADDHEKQVKYQQSTAGGPTAGEFSKNNPSARLAWPATGKLSVLVLGRYLASCRGDRNHQGRIQIKSRTISLRYRAILSLKKLTEASGW
jgi:hypothetical protein